jgi:hypothetical protein
MTARTTPATPTPMPTIAPVDKLLSELEGERVEVPEPELRPFVVLDAVLLTEIKLVENDQPFTCMPATLFDWSTKPDWATHAEELVNTVTLAPDGTSERH